MRNVVIITTSLSLAGALGCTPAHYRGTDEQNVAHGETTDAWMADPGDAGMHVTPPGDDAAVIPGEDAWVPPGHDAAVTIPDAWVAPSMPDAWSGSSCPTYGTDVRPIYAMHCGNCHTTGGDPHFGSSYTVANRTSSSCGTSMAECTIQLGQPGGSMAYRDPYGGFGTSDIQTIQSWIDCGRPM